MAKKKPQEPDKPKGVRIRNRKAFHDYHIIEKLECGLSLVGTEVKSLRAGQAKIDEAYARLERGELYLVGANIALYPQAGESMQHVPTRNRKLLVRRKQLQALTVRVQQKGLTLVPLTVYFHHGWAKCEIGIAQGKQRYDKRDALRKKDQQRDMERATRRRR